MRDSILLLLIYDYFNITSLNNQPKTESWLPLLVMTIAYLAIGVWFVQFIDILVILQDLLLMGIKIVNVNCCSVKTLSAQLLLAQQT